MSSVLSSLSLPRLAVLASGQGSNFEALVQSTRNQRLKAQVVGLICNKPEAPVLAKAKTLAIPSSVYLPSSFQNKADYEAAILQSLKTWQANWIILAGYMRLVEQTLLSSYPGRILNLHPSLLPKYPGLDAIQQAYQAGDEQMGVSVHYVTDKLDEGPIIAQASLAKRPGESLASIESRLHTLEHLLLPFAIAQALEQASNQAAPLSNSPSIRPQTPL